MRDSNDPSTEINQGNVMARPSEAIHSRKTAAHRGPFARSASTSLAQICAACLLAISVGGVLGQPAPSGGGATPPDQIAGAQPDEQSPPPLGENGALPAVVVIPPDFDRSVSRDLSKRLPLRQLLDNVKHFLDQHGVDARVEKPSGDEFHPPTEDELSLAEVDPDDDTISATVRAGYPNLRVPLVLLTVAERGPYLAAAAHLFFPDGRLSRVMRDVVNADAPPKTLVTNHWPQCLGAAIRRFVVDHQAAGENEQGCPAPVQKQPTDVKVKDPANQHQDGRAVTGTQSGQTGGPQGGSPLSVVVPPPKPPPPASGDAPDHFSSSQNVTRPAARPPSSPVQGPLLNRQSFPLATLLEQVAVYGLTWHPSDRRIFDHYVEANLNDQHDEVSQCLRKLPIYIDIADMMEQAVSGPAQSQSAFFSGRLGDSAFYRLERVPDTKLTHCFFRAGPHEFTVEFPQRGYLTLAGVKNIEENNFQDPEVRTPLAIEAFAIAEDFVRRGTDISIWGTIDGRHGIVSVDHGRVDFEDDVHSNRAARLYAIRR